MLDRGECAAGLYARDKNAVYYRGSIVPAADMESFRLMDDGYASDKRWWYGGGKPIARRERGDLRVLGTGRAAYAAHPEGVFYGARRLESEGFEVLGHLGYAKSRSRAYFRGEDIPGIDAASFAVFSLEPTIAKDRAKVVVNGRVDGRFDAASFEVPPGSGGGITRDRNHVYFQSEPIPGADSATFAPIGGGYWRDRKSLYYSGKLVSGADPDSFRLMDGRLAADKHRVYRDGKAIDGADPATFQIIWDAYSRDRNGIYFGDRIMPHVDADTFLVLGGQRARDKFHGFQSGKRVCAWTGQADLPPCDPAQYVR
jgi:hypothetical protein